MRLPIAMDDRYLYAGLIRLHVLHHAVKEAVYGLAMIEELGRRGYKASPPSRWKVASPRCVSAISAGSRAASMTSPCTTIVVAPHRSRRTSPIHTASAALAGLTGGADGVGWSTGLISLV
jgi:hypothetical protein